MATGDSRGAYYDWNVPARHTGGVTDDPAIAAALVQVELEAAETDTVGTIRKVRWSPGIREPTGASWTARRVEDGVKWESDWEGLPDGGAVRAVRFEP